MGWCRKTDFSGMLILLVVGCGIGVALTSLANAGDDIGGKAYCGKGVPKTQGPWAGSIEFPTNMGPPENWSNLDRVDVFQVMSQAVDKPIPNMDTDEVPAELDNEMKGKGLYVFPCAILKDKASWKTYWLNDPAAKQRIKLLKQTYERYMDCLYDHRIEINKLNKKVIERTCKKRTRWKPPGLESVAEGEM
jgi:hypothetical protein